MNIKNIDLKIGKQEIKVPTVKLNNNQTCLFPSIGKYNVYDQTVYDHLSHSKELSTLTKKVFKEAIYEECFDANVLDIGSGMYLDWAITAIEKGYASKAVALEFLTQTYNFCKEYILSQPYYTQKRIEIFNQSSFDFKYKKFDVIISETIGNIASSEGIIDIMNDARERLMIPHGTCIPYNLKTKACLFNTQEFFKGNKYLNFEDISIPYIEKIYNKFGIHDLPISIPNLNLKSTPIPSYEVILEDLTFDKIIIKNDAKVHQINLIKETEIDSLLVWVEIKTHKSKSSSISSLMDKTTWEPILIPLFNTPIKVNKKQNILLEFTRVFVTDEKYPDYNFGIYVDDIYTEYKMPYRSNIYGQKELNRKIIQLC